MNCSNSEPRVINPIGTLIDIHDGYIPNVELSLSDASSQSHSKSSLNDYVLDRYNDNNELGCNEGINCEQKSSTEHVEPKNSSFT